MIIDTRTAKWPPPTVPGIAALPLHQFRSEHVALIRWAPNTPFKEHPHYGGEEIFVIEGSFSDEFGD